MSEKEEALLRVLNFLSAQKSIIDNPKYNNDEFNKGRLYQLESVIRIVNVMIREDGEEDDDAGEYKRPLNTCEKCQEETRDRLEAARFFGARYLCCQRCVAAYEYKNEYRGDK
jgi:hypothetical protein